MTGHKFGEDMYVTKLLTDNCTEDQSKRKIAVLFREILFRKEGQENMLYWSVKTYTWT